jgi:hypothetical protein
MNVIEAIEAPELFAPWFPGATWAAWKAILRAAFALPMTPEELITFAEIAGGRAPPSKRVKELVVIAGRRSGKDSVASAIIPWIAAIEQGYLGLLRPGERASVLLLACDREQARIIRNYVGSYFQAIPELKAMVTGETKTGLELSNGVEIVVATNDFRAVRGRAVLCAVMDEAAFYSDENSASPDIETDRALEPALATLQVSIKIIISSPHKKSGLLFNKHRASYGKNDDRTLVVQAATPLLNSTIDPAIIERAMAEDPAAARAEWLAEFRNDISGFVDLETIERAITPGVSVRPPRNDQVYYAFADPASGSGGDSMCLAICHHEGDRRVLDCIVEKRPPFSPDQVCEEFAAVLKSYRVTTVTGDRWALGWPTERFQAYQIKYELAEKPKSEIYLLTLPLLNAGRASLLDNPRMVAQFVGLERRTARGSRDTVDHSRGSHDDICNVVCGALTTAFDDTPAIIRWTMDEVAMMRAGTHPLYLRDRKNEPVVRMRAPRDVSMLYLRDGKTMTIPDNRIVEISEMDARSLEASGRWSRIGFEEGVLH